MLVGSFVFFVCRGVCCVTNIPCCWLLSPSSAHTAEMDSVRCSRHTIPTTRRVSSIFECIWFDFWLCSHHCAFTNRIRTQRCQYDTTQLGCRNSSDTHTHTRTQTYFSFSTRLHFFCVLFYYQTQWVCVRSAFLFFRCALWFFVFLFLFSQFFDFRLKSISILWNFWIRFIFSDILSLWLMVGGIHARWSSFFAIFSSSLYEIWLCASIRAIKQNGIQ